MTTQSDSGASKPVVWKGHHVWLRRLRGDDSKRYEAFHAALDGAHIDRHREAALPDTYGFLRAVGSDDLDILIAAIVNDDKSGAILGVARASRRSELTTADVAIVLRPEMGGQGLGRLLMGALVNYCRDCGLHQLVGQTSADNARIIDLARAFRFVEGPGAVPGTVSLRLPLQGSIEEE